ncbi:MAG TPA: SDR family oxidoreductase [Pirellulaceae bacterium]|nr:SDR family oxidoreductase [Pirellulaceae bacterium]
MPTCLVTGGAGFVGSHIAEALVRRGDKVRVLDNFDTGKRENLQAVLGQVELITGSVADAAAVAKAVAGCEFVFHQAALASVPRSIDDPLATHAACATGTLNVLNEARKAKVRRVVYAASSSAYGNQPQPQKRETDLPSPLSPYAAAKLAAELYCEAFWHSYGLEAVALRYFNVFGPRQDPSGPYAAVIPIFIQKILAGQQPTIFGDGLQTRDFTYVENVVQANLKAAEATGAAGQVFNVGNGVSLTLLDLLKELNAIFGKNIQPIFQPARAGDVRDSLADISRARAVLGYEPNVQLAEGLRLTVEYYRGSAK